MSTPRALVAATLVLLPLAGCAEETPPILGVRAQGTEGFLMRPLDYGGAATPVQGDALVDVDAVANTGTVRVTATTGNDSYEVTWTRFAADPTKPFHDGGVATGFREHGASGVGDTSIPEVDLLAAGWGPATVTRNGQPYPDPVTGQPTWAGHFMVTDTGVFRADRSVRTAAGGEYDPARAGEGATEPGDLELHVVLKNNAGPPGNVTPIDVGGVAQGPVQQDLAAEVPEASAMNVTLFVRTTQPDPVPPVAQLSLVLRDPAGVEVTTFAYQTGGPTSVVVPVPDPAPGTWTVSVTGNGAASTYGARFAPSPPSSAQLYFVFEEVAVETR